MAPWTDHKGRLVPLKLATFLALFGPAFWVLWQWSQDDLGPKPVTEALHQTGTWAVYLLLGSLAVTPLRAIVYWPRLIDIRRMVGVAACLYLIGHFALYISDQKGDMLRVASEIVLRFYLTPRARPRHHADAAARRSAQCRYPSTLSPEPQIAKRRTSSCTRGK